MYILTRSTISLSRIICVISSAAPSIVCPEAWRPPASRICIRYASNQGFGQGVGISMRLKPSLVSTIPTLRQGPVLWGHVHRSESMTYSMFTACYGPPFTDAIQREMLSTLARKAAYLRDLSLLEPPRQRQVLVHGLLRRPREKVLCDELSGRDT